VEVFKSLNGVTNVADFRTLIGGAKVGLTQNANEITINDSNVAGLNTANTFTQTQTFGGSIYGNRSDDSYLALSNRNGDSVGANILLRHTTGLGDYGVLRNAGTSIMQWLDNRVLFYKKLNLVSSTNASPSNGDIWYDGSEVRIEGGLIISDGSFSLKYSSSTGALEPIGFAAYLGTPSNPFSRLRLRDKIELQTYTNSSPTTGDIWRDTTSGYVKVQGTLASNGDRVVTKQTKTITLETPTTSDTEIPIWYTDEAITVSEIFYEGIGGSSTTLNVQKKANLGDAGTNVNTSAITADTTKGSTTALSGASVSADNYLTLNVTAVSGSVSYVSVTIKYTVD
jgi:hypothetical protein